MWQRTAEVTISPDAVRIRHEAASGPECRLRAALLRFQVAPREGAPEAIVAGAAWEGPDGATYWGWPDEDGRVRLLPGPDRPEGCSILPPALSLALALRRSRVELGARVVVIGDAFLARVARAVVSAVGCRVPELAGRNGGAIDQAIRPDIVIETTGEPRNLEWAAERCGNWGGVYSVGGALTSGALDYYAHVHCRALTVTHVPHRPVLLPGEVEIAERSAARLAETVSGIVPAPDVTLEASVLPGGIPARLARDKSGWGLLLVEDR